MSDSMCIEPQGSLGSLAGLPGAHVDVSTAYPLQGGGVAPLGGATPAPVTIQPAGADRSELVWAGGAWSERRAGQRVQLATLSDPFANNALWYPAQYIGIDSANKSYSTGFWDNSAAYSPEAAQEIIYRWTIKIAQGQSVPATISVWRRPYGGVEYDTGITIPVAAGQTLATNDTADLTLSLGDEVMFVTDTVILAQHVQIFAHRLDS